MKFSARTIQILRNFSTINESLIFKQGKQLKTISQSKTILARATIDTEIEETFGIYDLGQFLSAISLFEEPELTLGNSSLTIAQGSEKINYVYSETSLMLSPPSKEIEMATVDVQFELKNDVLTKVQKALGIIRAPEIAITGDGDNIFVEALDTKDKSKSNYRVEVGTTDKTFRFIFLAENIKLLPGDYDVKISQAGLSYFKGDDVEYWVAVEDRSTFSG